MKFKYIGLNDEVEIPALGVTVKRGDQFDVPEHLVGRAYSESENEDGEKVVDLGEGFLAQHDLWQPVAAKAAKKTESQEG